MRNRWRGCGGRGCNRRMGQFLEPALLLLLKQSPAHGYTLLNRLAEFGLDFLTPTVVYRALRGMESQGWVQSTWDEEKTQGPPRRVYELTADGRGILHCCTAQLRHTRQVLTYFLALHGELASDNDPAAVQFRALSEEADMRIVVPVNGADLDAPTSGVFGRCSTFLLVDPETLDFEVLPNPAAAASGGAGVQAAQTVVQHEGVQAVLAPRLGTNAFRVIQAAGIPAYQIQGGTVREVVVAFQEGQLESLAVPGTDHVVGMGGGRRHG